MSIIAALRENNWVQALTASLPFIKRDNPYLDIVQPFLSHPAVSVSTWERFADKFAGAIPTDEALDAIKQHQEGGVVSIGAGRGYWESLLARRGVNVAAFDILPPREKFFRVWIGDASKAGDYATRALMLCFPLGAESTMSSDALEAYTKAGGKIVFFIGEYKELGCYTGNDAFFKMLGEEFSLVKKVSLPQRLHHGDPDHEYSFRDALYIFKRKKPS